MIEMRLSFHPSFLGQVKFIYLNGFQLISNFCLNKDTSAYSIDYPANKPRQDYILNVGTKKLYPKQNIKR